MPYYDLLCPVCEKEYTISASISDKTDNRIPCPDCGSFEMKTIYKKAPAYIKSRGEADCPNRHICGSGCHHAG